MVTVTADPSNPERLILTQTVTIYLDKLLLETLDDELAKAIIAQATKDLQSNTAVKRLVARAATEKLLSMLGYVDPGVEKEEKK